MTINVTGNGSVTPVSGTIYNDGEAATLMATPDAGWQFDGWSGDASGNANPLQLTMDADKTVTAMFSPILRGLTIFVNDGNALSAINFDPPPVESQEGIQFFEDGTIVEVTLALNLGWQLDGWNGDASGTDNPLTIVMDANKSVTATLSQIQRTLTINTTGNGSVTPASGTMYNEGDVATLTAIPDMGWQFDGWSGDASGADNPLQLTMDADKTVTAIFSQTLGINEEEFNTGFNLYPNPADTYINIDYNGSISSIAIYSVLGNELNSIREDISRVDVSSLASGVYLMVIETERGRSLHKFIKK